MKRVILKIISALICGVILIGCDSDRSESRLYTLNFVGEEIALEPQSIAHGNHATAPENPERENFRFGGWFTDNGAFANEWDFETNIVTQDTTLYAKWEEISLKGTKWKLAGIVDTETGDLKELEPKDCDECYTFTFDTDSTAIGWITSNDLIVNLRPVLSVFSASKALGSDFYIEEDRKSVV